MSSTPFSWLRLVHAPLLVVAPGGDSICAANAAAERLIGADLSGRALRCALGAFATDRLQPLLHGAAHDGEMVLQCVTPAGIATYGFRAAPMAAGMGFGDGGTVLTLTDYGAREPVPGRSIDWARTLEAVVDGLPVGVEIYDAQFNEMFANRLSDDLFAYDYAGKVPHHDDWWAHSFPDPAHRAAVVAEWRAEVARARAAPDQYSSMEHEVRCRDGSRRIVQFRFRFIGDTYTVVFWDVTERRRLEEDLRRLAGTDELTGLINRRGFTERALAALSAREGAPQQQVTLLMMDVDHFKRINDLHGHAIGDRVLKEMARRCRRALRPDDVLARFGGEEFAILLPDTTQPQAHRTAETLLAAIGGTPMDFGSLALTVEASIGGVSAATGEATLEYLLEFADRALYAAKAGGRNRAVLEAGAA